MALTVTTWANSDEAYQNIAEGISRVVKVIDFFENNDVMWALREAWVGKARSLKALSDQAFQKAQELGYTGEA